MTSKRKGLKWTKLRATLFGKPIASSRAHHERLSPVLGLPIYASDALSSVAYATEAILAILILAGTGALKDQILLTVGICSLIIIISISYNQTIHAYPSGGGSYIVASHNLGERTGLIAGAALLIDYVLTVSVSVAAGVAAIVSAFPSLHEHLVGMSLVAILIIAWLNLRGLKESGVVFAVPVYAFIAGMLVMIGYGFFHGMFHPAAHQTATSDVIGKELHVSALFLLLRAFAAGCTALTGVEAVSNGVPSFKPPESKNASITLRLMTVLLVIMFLGLGFMARSLPTISLYSSNDPSYRSLVSQVASQVFGGSQSFGFYYIQFATALILVLAANTSFADFPRLASLMARDGYMPRSLSRQGDRLVFHNGIIFLALFAGGLVWYFKGQLDLLLPLYAVGVFTAFTLSQTGMVIHWKRERVTGWRRNAFINGLGAIFSGLVLLIILVTKFMEGAWIVAVLLAFLYVGFTLIKRRYMAVSTELTLHDDPPAKPDKHLVLVLVPRVHRGVITALEYALLIQGNCRAIHVTIDERTLPALRRGWEKYGEGVPLVILNSPYRSLIEPVLNYLDELAVEEPDQVITVIVPEAISSRWFQKLLQENVALQLKVALSTRQNVVVTNVRYFLN